MPGSASRIRWREATASTSKVIVSVSTSHATQPTMLSSPMISRGSAGRDRTTAQSTDSSAPGEPHWRRSTGAPTTTASSSAAAQTALTHLTARPCRTPAPSCHLGRFFVT